jgi:hypothetical protein
VSRTAALPPRRRALLAGAAALLGGLAPLRGPQAAERLEPDEEALFLPGTARPTPDGRLEIDIHAWVYERERRWGLNAVFARYLGLDLKNLSPAARLRFNQRTALFHAESEEGKVFELDFDGAAGRLTTPPSGADGRVDMRAVIDMPQASPASEWQRFHAVTGPGELLHRFRGQSLIVPAEGLSVISDIDDTIKRTQVRDRRAMLLNTFARRFEPTPGMAAFYRSLARVPDTRFHYLSASPIQLYPALADFVREADFPAGSMHLRESTTWRTLIPGDQDSRTHKLGVIERLLADFPARRFMLVGDSGESDPEIYAQVARTHPSRIAHIAIRDVTGEDARAERYAAAFDGIDAALWQVFPGDRAPSPGEQFAR